MMRYHLFSQQENHQKDLILSCSFDNPTLQPAATPWLDWTFPQLPAFSQGLITKGNLMLLWLFLCESSHMPQHCSGTGEQESSLQGRRDTAHMPCLSQAGEEQGTFQVVGSHNQCTLQERLFLELGEAGGHGGLQPHCLGSNGSSALWCRAVLPAPVRLRECIALTRDMPEGQASGPSANIALWSTTSMQFGFLVGLPWGSWRMGSLESGWCKSGWCVRRD